MGYYRNRLKALNVASEAVVGPVKSRGAKRTVGELGRRECGKA
jgi:hypothetical protein